VTDLANPFDPDDDGDISDSDEYSPVVDLFWNHAPVEHHDIAAIHERVVRSGIPERLAEWRQKDRGDRHAGGVNEGAKYLQPLTYRSAEWQMWYTHGRQLIEAANRHLKHGAHNILDDPGRRRVRGQTAQHLFVAILVLAANLRRIHTFQQQGRRPRQRTVEPPAHACRKATNKPPRSRTTRLGDFAPASGAPPGDDELVS
jgi:hypothetical protein